MKKPNHFFHANGFPAETYKELLGLIDGDIQDPLSVIGKQIPEVKEGYHEFTDEIIEHASKTHGEGFAKGSRYDSRCLPAGFQGRVNYSSLSSPSFASLGQMTTRQ